MARICIIGTGYVGLITGVCFANRGNKIVCIDIDKEKIKKLNNGEPTIFENGLKEALKKAIENKSIEFTSNLKEAIKNSEIIFITVGTPQTPTGEADLTHIKEAAKEIGLAIDSYKIITNKSTVPVGTAELVKQIITEEQNKRIQNKTLAAFVPFAIVSNPEFLSEGNAIEDFENERIIIGADGEKEREIMLALYKKTFNDKKNILVTDTKSAELIKYASNAMLALRISFMNEIAELSEKIDADILAISQGIGMDPRIGSKFLNAGAGYGGSCFPKDVRALETMLINNNCAGTIVKAIDETNERQKAKLIEKVKKLVPVLNGKTICVLGLSFKPNTDDVRESPALVLIKMLQKEGAKVKAYDPEGMDNAKSVLHGVDFNGNSYEAIKDTDAVIVITTWDEFKKIDWQKAKQLMKCPNLFDARNVFDPKEMRKIGFNYTSIGRQ